MVVVFFQWIASGLISEPLDRSWYPCLAPRQQSWSEFSLLLSGCFLAPVNYFSASSGNRHVLAYVLDVDTLRSQAFPILRQIESSTIHTSDVNGMLDRANSVKTLLTVAFLALVLVLSSNVRFYYYVLLNPYSALSLCGAVIILLMVQPLWTNVTSVLLGSLVLAGLDYRVMGFNWFLITPFSFLGLSGLAVLGTRTIWARHQERAFLLYAFLPAILFEASEVVGWTFLNYTGVLHPKTFDLYLYSFDCSLRAQFSFLFGQVFASHRWLMIVGIVFYTALPLPLALVYASHLRLRNNNTLAVALAFLVTGPLGALFYNMVPATGPLYIFGQNFPWHPLSTAQAMHMVLETIPVKGPRNAIPSLHMAWVLLAWWNSERLSRWIRVIALAFVIFTVFATLGTGQHYLVDLVVAFPFALMVQALCACSLSSKYGPRRIAFLVGAFTTLAWMALVSFATPFFWISPIIPWTMVMATIFTSSWLMQRLQDAEFANERAPQQVATLSQPDVDDLTTQICLRRIPTRSD